MTSELPASCDLLVIGSGAAGLTAALVAGLAGLKVVVCEKADRIGGTTAISGGTCWVPGNHLADPSGSGEDVAAARTYLESEIGPDDALGRREAFLRHAREAFAFLAEKSELRFSLPKHYPDYHPDQPGASQGGRAIQPLPFDGMLLGNDFARLGDPLFGLTILGGMMFSRPEGMILARPFSSWNAFRFSAGTVLRHLKDRLRHPRGTRLLLGNALVARLMASLQRLHVPILTGVAMTGLIERDGRIVGARFGDREIQSRKGVVLATGGFTSSREWREKLLPKEVRHALSAPGATGDGLAAALAIGAQIGTGHAISAFCMPVSKIRLGDKRERLFPHVIVDRARPGVIAVDGMGKRFVNEGNSYHDFVEAMVSRGMNVAYLICDRASLRRFGLGLVRPVWQWLRYYTSRGYLVSAPTVADLAKRISVPAEALSATIARHNASCITGIDEEFGKGSNSLNLMYGDTSAAPNPCLGPIRHSPFVAIPVEPAAIGGSVGLETDARARVLGLDGKPVPGLFACGNDASSIMRGRYAGAGITLGPAITFAYLAARTAAETGE